MLNRQAKHVVAEALGVPTDVARQMIRYAAQALGVTEETMRARILRRRISPRLVRKLAELGGWVDGQRDRNARKGSA